MNREKTRGLVLTAAFAALVCVLAPWSVPLPGNPVPVTLATFALYLVAGCAGPGRGLTATVVYLCLGAAGIPVFSGFRGGIGVFAGPTGGYLLGYLFLVGIAALVSDHAQGKAWLLPVGMITGTAALYLFGTAWFMIYTKTTLAAALASCVVPFLIGDAVKIAAATLITPKLRRALQTVLNARTKKD